MSQLAKTSGFLFLLIGQMGSEVSDDTRYRKNLIFWFDAYTTACLASAYCNNGNGSKHAGRHCGGLGCRYLLACSCMGRVSNVAASEKRRSKAASYSGHTR